jgi:hypothetical protein
MNAENNSIMYKKVNIYKCNCVYDLAMGFWDFGIWGFCFSFYLIYDKTSHENNNDYKVANQYPCLFCSRNNQATINALENRYSIYVHCRKIYNLFE